LKEAHIEHLFLKDSFSSDSLPNSAESNTEAKFCRVAAQNFNSSEDMVLDKCCDTSSAIINKNGRQWSPHTIGDCGCE